MIERGPERVIYKIVQLKVRNEGRLTSKYKHIVCTLKNYNINSREKFEPGPGFEPRTSRSLAWRSTT